MRILVLDDDIQVAKSLCNFLEFQLGHQPEVFDRVDTALESFRNNPQAMVLSDIRMPGMDGIELAGEIRAVCPSCDVVLMTGFPDTETAVRALRAGVYDYLRKPVNIEELAAVVERVAEHQALLLENHRLKQDFNESVKEETENIGFRMHIMQSTQDKTLGPDHIGLYSNSMRKVAETALRYHRDRTIPVVIEGETGTGKELIARLIHYGLSEQSGPFVSLNCSAIPETLFESELFGYEKGAFTGADSKGRIGKLELAQGGTLFLDEIGEMPMSIQPKLLRILQEKEMYRVGGLKKIQLDVRILCATNRNLAQESEAGRFRSDLYYRINLATIHIPAIRQRPEEIIPLSRHFLEQFARERQQPLKMLAKDAEDVLTSYNWPGNVRQLRNAVERAAFLTDSYEIHARDLAFLYDATPGAAPPDRGFALDFPAESISLYDIQEQIVRRALALFDGNKTKTASYLQISINKLRRILKEM